MDFVRDNPGELVPEETFTHSYTYRGHQSSLICFIHLIRSMAFSLFNPCTWQSFFHNLSSSFFGLPLGLAPSSSYSIHFFTQSLSSFRSTCPYHHNLFCCNELRIISRWHIDCHNCCHQSHSASSYVHSMMTTGCVAMHRVVRWYQPRLVWERFLYWVSMIRYFLTSGHWIISIIPVAGLFFVGNLLSVVYQIDD